MNIVTKDLNIFSLSHYAFQSHYALPNTAMYRLSLKSFNQWLNAQFNSCVL